MTLSSLIGSLTRRDAAPVPATRPASTPASSPDALRMLHSGAMQFVSGKESERGLGSAHEVRERIADVLPGVAFDEDGRGAFKRTGYEVWFDTGSEDRVEAVGVRTTGGAAALPSLQRLSSKTGWKLEPRAGQ